MKLLPYILFSLALLPLEGATPTPHTQIDESQDVVKRMDALITATEESLKRQKTLQALLLQYKEKEKRAINHPDDTDNLLELIQLATAVKESIASNYLEDYFPPQFLEELNKLALIAKKKNIPPTK